MLLENQINNNIIIMIILIKIIKRIKKTKTWFIITIKLLETESKFKKKNISFLKPEINIV